MIKRKQHVRRDHRARIKIIEGSNVNTLYLNVKNQIGLAAALFFLTTLPSWGATPAELSCDFVASFQKSQSSAAKVVRKIFFHVEDETYKKRLQNVLNGLPEKFENGQIVEIANVGNLFVEHFIVMNSSEIGSIYFRIIYEKIGDSHGGVKLYFDSDAEDAMNEWSVLQQPIEVQC